MRVAAFDFRTLAPRELVDANGNHTEAAFDILGRVVATATKGKPQPAPAGGWQGDDLAALTATLADPDEADVQAFCLAATFDEATARTWLGRATARFVHHFGERRDPVSGAVTWADRMAGACAITREQHVGPAAASPLQVSLSCSDGSGAVRTAA